MSKGGQQQQTTQIDPRLSYGASQAVGEAFKAASLPYAPNRGVTISAFTPQQTAAFQGANEAAAAFGLPTAAPAMPAPDTTAGGIQGYSTGGIYDQSIARSLTQQEQQQRSAMLSDYRNVGQRIQAMPAPKPAGGGK